MNSDKTYNWHGDRVTGDKVMGDQVGGDKVTHRLRGLMRDG